MFVYVVTGGVPCLHGKKGVANGSPNVLGKLMEALYQTTWYLDVHCLMFI